MRPNEPGLTAKEVQARLAERRGNKVMHHATLARAVRNHGLPSHPRPFARGAVFYWSEVEEWLIANAPSMAAPAPRRPVVGLVKAAK